MDSLWSSDFNYDEMFSMIVFEMKRTKYDNIY